jgi:hypothetical protein
MRHCASACALDHQGMDVSSAIYVAVTGRECIQRPKTPLVDYQRGFLYIAVRVWDTSWVTVQWGIGLKVICIDAAVNFCLRLWLVYVRRPPLSVPVLEE